ETERACGLVRRKPFCCKVPKRGLEPPLPKREPGPEPGGSATLSHRTHTANTLQVLNVQTVRTHSRLTHIVGTLGWRGQCFPQIFPKGDSFGVGRAGHAEEQN